MPKATQGQQELFEKTVEVAAYRPRLSDPKNKLRLVEVDDVPEPDERGWRRADGWSAAWEGVVDSARRLGSDMYVAKQTELGNFSGNLHGAATSWIVDTCTSAALVALHTDTFWGMPMLAGVSVNLNTEYYHPGAPGATIRVEVQVVKLTTTLANLRCDIRDVNIGKLLSSSTHLKAWRPARDSKL